MADRIFNIAKGRIAAYHDNVQSGDVASAVLRAQLLVSSGTTDDARDNATSWTSLLATGTTVEFVGTGYTAGGKVLADADLTALDVDNTNNWVNLKLTADPVWTSLAAGNGPTTHIVFSYDPDGTNTPANNIPLSIQDFAVTPNGGDVTADVGVNGYARAS